MSRRLPPDLQHLILSYLPLEQFDRCNFAPNFWVRRYLNRYHEQIDTKVTYLVRAASEHYEVCMDTLTYLDPNIICYYLAKSKNWILAEQILDIPYLRKNKYDAEIFVLACKDNAVSYVKNYSTFLVAL